MQRKIYLSLHSLAESQKLFWTRFAHRDTGEESVASRSAVGRVTARPVCARLSSPSFHSAAMDGLAVRAEDTFAARDDAPLTLRLDGERVALINTGYPMPPQTDAVIMIENVLLDDRGTEATIRAPAYPWQHVRKVGEDIVATELLFPAGHQLRPPDIGALLTGGYGTVLVRRRPRVVIIPTGSELVPLEECLEAMPADKTIESNASVLAGLAEQAGAEARILPIVPDDCAAIEAVVRENVASDADLILLNAGSSAGSADYTLRILEKLGTVLVHGITIMPGKPTILGDIAGKPVVGLPGYPVSAIIAMEQVVLPLLAHMQGIHLPPPDRVRAILAKDIPSKAGIEEFRRVTVGRINGSFVAVPLKQGAGTITSLTRANGIFRIAAASEGEKRACEVDVDLLVPRAQAEQTILCTGSHDLCLDLLGDLLNRRNPAHPLASAHVGSLGGIMALKEGMCHLAGSHLLDPDDGSYNINAIRTYLAGRDIRVVTLVHREQGFIVARGNPKNIHGVQDLYGNNVRFINRQAGSGTRVLLDYELQRQNLDPDGIDGYRQDEYTHMAVAVAVLSGKADTGLGIKGAAKALALDFVPLAEERYDLLIPGELFDTPMIRAVLETIGTVEFQNAVMALGGYSTRDTGKLIL